MRATRVSVLGQLIERVRDTPDEALEYARQLLALDPLSEASHIRLIRLLGDMGRTREAIPAQYDRCKRVLASELGAQPSPELQLARMNLSGTRSTETVGATRAPAAEPLPSDRPLHRRSTPVPGRSPSWVASGSSASRASCCIWRPKDPSTGFSKLSASPGSGRPRSWKSSRGRLRVLAAWSSPEGPSQPKRFDRMEPGSTLCDRSPSGVPSGLRADLLPLLPELDSSPPIAGDRNRLFDAVTKLLTSLAPTQAVVVVILDDVQWFDEASAALLHFAARELSRSHVLLACGARPAELADNPVALRLLAIAHPRAPADRDRALAHGQGGNDGARPRGVDRCRSQRVYSESEGNPFFAMEIARALETGEPSFSKTLEQLIADRFDRLEVQTVALLGWTAALGRSFRIRLSGKLSPSLPPIS